MPATLKIDFEATLTERYQTTVPATVRRVLKLRKRDKIHFTIRPSGEVVMTRAVATSNDDPVLGQFLNLLAHDIAKGPKYVRALDTGLVNRVQSLVGDVTVDLDAPLLADDE